MTAYADPVAQAEVERLRAALRLAVSTLTLTLNEAAELGQLAGIPEEYDDDRDLFLETIHGKLAEVERLRGRVAELEARERRVRALHARWPARLFPTNQDCCLSDGYRYPCETIAALDGTQP